MVKVEVLLKAAELFNRKHYFECHEVLEEEWREALGDDKVFLQGLIMLAVGLYHAAAGNSRGAVSQLEKSLARLEPFLPQREGLDLEALNEATRNALGKVRRGLERAEPVWTEADLPHMRFIR